MKISSLQFRILSVAILYTIAPSLQAQTTATTNPVGFVTVSASNKPTSAGGYNYLSLPLNRTLAYQGVIPVGGVSPAGTPTVLTFSGAPFSQNQFNGAANAHYLEITNGANAGELTDITATNSTTITLTDNITAAIATDGTTSFRIWPQWTFATAFGTPDGSAAAILGGTSASVADVLTIMEPSVANVPDQVRYYYYNNNTAAPGWRRASSETDANAGDDTPANDSIIRRDCGIQFLRRSATAASLIVMGAVKTGPTGIQIEGAAADTTNLISNPYPLASNRLDQSGLYTGNAATGLVGGTAADADLVRILDPQTGVFTDFFYETSSGRWKTGLTDASLYSIPTGASAAIIRKAGRSSFTWYSPQPAMNLGSAIPALQLLSVVSRKTHPGAGVGGTNFYGDVNLPLSGTIGIEPRTGSSSVIVFTFSNNLANAGSATVNSGTGSVLGTPSFSGNQATANLTGVADVQSLTLTLDGVVDTNGQALSSNTVTMRLLAGDVNGSGSVSVGDLQAIKNYLIQPITIGNFRADTNTNSSISVSDLQNIKNNLTKSVP